jgi:hypothetical protein
VTTVVNSPKNVRNQTELTERLEEPEPKSESKPFKGRADFKLKLGAKPGSGVPKLDLKQLKNLNEFKDW